MIAILNRNNKTLHLVIAFVAILTGHYCLKALELSDFSSNGNQLIAYFDIGTYADRPWQLLLPINIGDNFYRYTTTGLVPMATIQKLWASIFSPELSMNLTFLTLSTLLVLTTYMTAWKATHSKTFTMTVTICMAFGTQFHGLYANSSIMILYLFYTFIEINLLCFYLLLISPQASTRLKAGFVLSLICVALCWEMWLDYAVFIYVVLAVLYVVNFKKKIKFQFARLNYVLISLSAMLIIYLAIKVNTGEGIAEHFSKGKESESVVNYLNEPESKTSLILMEDVLSNLLTYNYIAFSNYLPPFLLSSNSLFYLGKKTSDYQYGYHGESGQFVYYHHIFYWYYFAGAFFVLLLIVIYKTARTLWSDPDHASSLILLLIMSMILFGSFTHLFIKYRPYLSVPLLGYKCIISTLGVTLYIGLVAMRVRENVSMRKFYWIVSFIWITIIAGGFFRPARLLELGREVMPLSAWEQLPDPMNPSAIYYFFFPGSITYAQGVEKWLNADGGNVVDKSLVTIQHNGAVIYTPDTNWKGRLSGSTIVWKNVTTGKTAVWSPQK